MLDQSLRRTTVPAILFWMLVWTADVAGAPHYRVSTDEQLQQLNVSACFGRELPARLSARQERARTLLRGAWFASGDQRVELKSHGATLRLPDSVDSACVQYRVDLSAIGRRQWRSGDWRARDVIVLDPDLWLWYPDGVAEHAPLRLDFVLPPGYDVSGPWQRTGSAQGRVSYAVRERMPGWDARMAIGRFKVESIELPGGRLRYALLPGEPGVDAAALHQWVTGGARALVSAYGRLPVPDVQLLVVPIARGGEPVPWGEVQRGGGDAVHLYIDQRRPAAEFMADWVLVHELSHLLHPNIAATDRWLSEGIASYYQNVLRARAGLVSAERAWDKLHAGFERGIRGTAHGRSLADASETMMRERAFMRVYWSGAAIALLADVELRRRSGGAQSLDTALAAFSACCLPADHSWSAPALLRELDRLTGTGVFMELYRKYVDSDRFPALGALYADLGLQPVSETRLRLDPTAPQAAIRAAIMHAPEG